MKSRVVVYTILLFLLIFAVCFKYNADTLFALLGNYYYKHNNISKAQLFYEKSFRLGNKDADLREMYVNTIITSPLTIDAQDKLVQIAEGDIVDAASIKAKNFLYDLKRELHRKYSMNYIKQAPYNQKIVRWNKLPITYSFKNQSGVPPEFKQEIQNAFSEWEKLSSLMFTEVHNGNANILIEFHQNKSEDLEYGKKYVVAYTVPQVNANKLENMKINFYLQDPEGHYFTANQVYNTALHEIFHALGFMGHSYDPENIMYLSKDSKSTINDDRKKLTEADIETLKLLYKIRPDITNSNDLKSEYVPYLILGDNEEVNTSKVKEAKIYIYHAPTLPSGYIDLAESLVAEKRYPDAIRSLEKALSLADTDEIKYIIYYNLAVSYFYINHFEMTMDYINKAMSIKNSEELHFLLAETFIKQGKTEAAIKEYEKLIVFKPDNIDYTINLANIYIKKYNYLKARKILKNYLRINPKEKDNVRLHPYGALLF